MGTRRTSDWYEDDFEEPVRAKGRRTSGASRSPGRTFGLPVVAAALVGGLFIGYVVSSGGGGTTTITDTRTVTAPLEAAAPGGVAPAPESARATIALAFLNGSGEAGLAASTGEEARGIGYQDVTEGNAPAPVPADIVLYREGAAPRAARVAADLGLAAPELATADDPALAAAPDADVVVILGPTGAAGAEDATGAEGAAGADGAVDDGTVETPADDGTDAATPTG
ncbi:MAG: LytR C-terminal domain-containing protein [Thermoleophilia bacterium]